jgi:hypothetical protein
MNNSPFRSDAPAGDDRPYAWLDEWLCEYVDGTMDPALETVFEEYMHANPDLEAHVARLKETRDLLCQCGRVAKADCSPATRADVCGTVEGEMLRSNDALIQFVSEHPSLVAGLTSSVVAFLLGLFAGALMFSPDSASPALPMAPTPAVERAASERTAGEHADEPPALRRATRSYPAFSRTVGAAPAASALSLLPHADTVAVPALMRVDARVGSP